MGCISGPKKTGNIKEKPIVEVVPHFIYEKRVLRDHDVEQGFCISHRKSSLSPRVTAVAQAGKQPGALLA